MRKRRVIWAVVGVVILLVPCVGLALLSLSARRPDGLGAVDGHLRACPDTPNCVSSQSANESQYVAPFPLADQDREHEDLASRSIERLAAAVSSLPRARIVSQSEDYLHAEFTSGVFRFVDDVEFQVDLTGGVVHCRSASRVGRSDLGANRQRIELIRAAMSD